MKLEVEYMQQVNKFAQIVAILTQLAVAMNVVNRLSCCVHSYNTTVVFYKVIKFYVNI